MIKKTLLVLLTFVRWAITLAALVYLIVPGYAFDKWHYIGENFYDPYAGWNKTPLFRAVFENRQLTAENGAGRLYATPVDFKAPVLLLDTTPRVFVARFFLGYSRHDIQYLISHKKKKAPGAVLMLDPSKQNAPPAYSGLDLIEIHTPREGEFLDRWLGAGRPVAAIAASRNSFAANLIAAGKPTPSGLLEALKQGRNLMVFSDENPYDSSQASIPVIRKIEWKDNTLNLDLSEPGLITLHASGFRLDTLARHLFLKFKGQDWLRFAVRFEDRNITYLSNAIYTETEEIESIPVKADNFRTIFINLLWLIAIIVFNLLMPKVRKLFLT